MFLQRVEKKDTNSHSEKPKQTGLVILYFSNQFRVQEFCCVFQILSRLNNQTITMNQEKIVISQNSDYK